MSTIKQTKNLWPLGLGSDPTDGASASSRRLVVGTTGSQDDLAAVAWAAREAHRRGAVLVVVHAWERPPAPFGYPTAVVPDRIVADEAAEALSRSVKVAQGGGGPVESQLVEGSPVDALIDAAKNAELLVLGCRHRHHRWSPVHFHQSVTGRCMRQVGCPIVIVPQLRVARTRPGTEASRVHNASAPSARPAAV